VLPYVVVTLVATLALVAGEWKDIALVRWISKPVASSGFLLTAFAAGAWSSPYGRVLLVALAFCLVGDLFLLPASKMSFSAGLGSFLAGHAMFAAAFFARGVDRRWIAVALAVLLPTAFLVIRWLSPHLRGPMRIAVPVYVFAIVAMGSAAAGTFGAAGDSRILAGAILFQLSDLAVARNRFIQPAAINRVVGLPLYYAAQLLLAASVASRV
jgi:uncharacterized membrane protein YhhN